MTADINGTIDSVWRIESAKLIAGLTRMVRDVGLAEDLAQDALVAALEQWPREGIPSNPGAWLMSVGKRRAIDRIRRNALSERKRDVLVRDFEVRQELAEEDIDSALDAAAESEDVGDDLLRLMFIACHPVLSTDARVALTLRLLGGLTTEEIARAFLVPEPTLAQRIVRAKRTLSEARIPFELPDAADRNARLDSVLEVIYLIFNEGYSATAGDDWIRPALCEDAMRLGRVMAELTPDEGEVHGLVALMEIQASRSRARVGPSGEPILLLEQNRSRWDQLLIRRGLKALERAAAASTTPGPYTLQAEIAACHARAATAESTDWARIVSLYNRLHQIQPTPIVGLNRAVALSLAEGPAAGLEAVDKIAQEPVLRGYHLLPSVRGDFLMKLGRHYEARAEFIRAAAMTRNAREQRLLMDRAEAAADQATPG